MRTQIVTCDYPGCGASIDPAALVHVEASLPGHDVLRLDLCPTHAPQLAAAVGVTITYPAPDPAPAAGGTV